MTGIAYSGLGAAPKTAEGAVQLYDEWADDYDKCLISWGFEAPDRVAALLKGRMKADGKVLDLGCGTGMSGEALINAGMKGAHVGIDISPKSIEISSKKGCYSGGAFVGSLETEFTSEITDKGPFDAVISVGVFSYVHNFELLWSEVLKNIVPGGYLIFTHRDPYWKTDVDGIQTEAAKRVLSKEWTCVSVSEPMPYMPQNPDPAENSKVINYVVYRKLGGDDKWLDGNSKENGGYGCQACLPCQAIRSLLL